MGSGTAIRGMAATCVCVCVCVWCVRVCVYIYRISVYVYAWVANGWRKHSPGERRHHDTTYPQSTHSLGYAQMSQTLAGMRADIIGMRSWCSCTQTGN